MGPDHVVPCKPCYVVKTDPKRSEEPLIDFKFVLSDFLYSKATGA